MSPERTPVYRVGDVDVDLGARLLSRGGTTVHLRQQTFQVLVQLLSNRHRVVGKDELLREIWGGTAVTDDALTQCIKELRRAFGDDTRDPRFIRTVPRVGYHFIGPVDDLATTAASTSETDTIRSVSVQVEEQRDARAPSWIAVASVAALIVAVAVAAGALALWRTNERVQASPGPGTTNLEAYRLYSQGVQRADAYHQAEGLELLQRAIALDPDFVMAQARIGYIYAMTDGLTRDEAKPYLERAFRRSEGLPEHDRLLIRAWYDVANDDFIGAIEQYRELIARDPNDTEAYWRLGHLLIGEEQTDAAIAVLERGLAIDPESRQINNELGAAYTDAGRYDDAIRARERYVRLAPAEPNALDSLGLVYQEAGRTVDAMATFDRAIALDPAFAIAWIHRGDLRYRLGRYRLAIDDFQRYIDLQTDPTPRARGEMNIAWVRFRIGDMPGADVHVRKAIADDARTPLSWIWYAIVRAEDVRRAAQSPAGASSPGRGSNGFVREELYRRALVALDRGDRNAAMALARDLQRHRPSPWDIEGFDDALGDLYLWTGSYRAAVVEFERLVKIRSQPPIVHFHLAQAYAASGDAAAARVQFARFVNLWRGADPDVPELREARQKLGTAR